jgi:hypothetical protein
MSEDEIMLRLAPDGDEFDVVGDDDHGSEAVTVTASKPVCGCRFYSMGYEVKASQLFDYSTSDDCPIHDPDYEDEPEVDDDFPMYLEYDGLWGASDFENDQASAREDEYEREMYGGY